MSNRIEIDFNAVLRDLDGEPFEENDKDGDVREITLGQLARVALVANVASDKGDQAQVYKRFRLAEKLLGKTLDEDEDEQKKYAVVSLNITQRKMIADAVFRYVRAPVTMHGQPMPHGAVLFSRCNEILSIESDVEEDEE